MRSIRHYIVNLPEYLPGNATSMLQNTPIDSLYSNIIRKAVQQNDRRLSPVSVTLPDQNEYTFFVANPSYQLSQIREIGVYEPPLTIDLFDRLSSESVFYDIGSWFGYYTQLAKHAGVPDDRIYAFEADPDRFTFLARSHDSDAINAINSRVSGPDSSDLTIDEFAAEETDPTVVKIDVEGAEGKVLRGMGRVLADSKPALYVEVHPQVLPSFDSSVDGIVDLLLESGYRLEMIDHRSDEKWVRTDPANLPRFSSMAAEMNSPDNTYLLKAVADV